MVNQIIFIISLISLFIVIPNNTLSYQDILGLQTEGGFKYSYEDTKSLFQNGLDLCGSSSWLTSLFQKSPSKEECDKIMMNLYSFCQTSNSFVDALAEGFNRQIQPGSLGSLVKEQCNDEKLLNYDYPDSFRDVINKYQMNQKSTSTKIFSVLSFS